MLQSNFPFSELFHIEKLFYAWIYLSKVTAKDQGQFFHNFCPGPLISSTSTNVTSSVILYRNNPFQNSNSGRKGKIRVEQFSIERQKRISCISTLVYFKNYFFDGCTLNLNKRPKYPSIWRLSICLSQIMLSAKSVPNEKHICSILLAGNP